MKAILFIFWLPFCLAAQTNHVFITQTDVNNFVGVIANGDSIVIGDQNVNNDKVTSVSGLNFPDTLYQVFIRNTELSSLDWNGFPKEITSKLILNNNPLLTSLFGLSALESGGELNITACDQLTSLNGLSLLKTLGTSLALNNNDGLTDLTALSILSNIDGYLYIGNNNALTSLQGLNAVNNTIYSSIIVENNPMLSNCQALENLLALLGPSGTSSVSGNGPGCHYSGGLCGNGFKFDRDTTFTTQTQLENFVSTYGSIDSITGLIILEGNLTDLSPLACVQYVNRIRIRNCPLLKTTGLFAPKKIKDIGIVNCALLESISSLHFEGSINEYLHLENLPMLTDFFTIGPNLIINKLLLVDLDQMTALPSMSNVSHVYTYLDISNNPNLQDISGIYGNYQVFRKLILENNGSLNNCFPLCEIIDEIDTLILDSNPGCLDTSSFFLACDTLGCSDQVQYLECQENELFIDHSTILDSTDTKQAIHRLRSNRSIPNNQDITFKAEECIELLPNFVTQPGAIFSAQIDSCEFLGDYITDLIPFIIPNSNNFSNQMTYPSEKIKIYSDKECYFQSDQNGQMVIAFHPNSFLCRSVDISLYNASTSTLIDKRYTNLDNRENLEILINIPKLFEDGHSSITLVVRDLAGYVTEKQFEISPTNHIKTNLPSLVPLHIIHDESIVTNLSSLVSGAVSFPNGWIKKSELKSLRLSTNDKILVKPVSYWYKDSEHYDPYVKWVKILFKGNIKDNYSLFKNGGSNAIVDIKSDPQSFQSFSTNHFSNIDTTDNSLVFQQGSQTIQLQPLLSMGNSATIDNILLLESNDFRKVIKVTGQYNAQMNFSTIIKFYQELEIIDVDHQDIFTDQYHSTFMDGNFINQLGWKISGLGDNDNFDYWYEDNNGAEHQENSTSFVKQIQKNQFYNGARLNGQLIGAYKYGEWNVAVKDMANRFPMK